MIIGIDEEVWKPIPGYPNYKISSLGRVRVLNRWGKTIMRKPWLDKDGYAHVNLWRDSKQKRHSVHILVATVFIGPKPFQEAQVCHEDNNRTNCRVDNLRWDTCANNHKDKLKHGTYAKGDSHPRSKYSEALVEQLREDIKKGIRGLGRKYGVPAHFVHDIKRGRRL